MSTATIVLVAGSASATVHPDDGGRLGQLTVDGTPLLRGPEDAAHLGWGHWGAYPLLPWSNRIPGGRFGFEGRDLEVPVTWEDGSALHGLAAREPWRVVEAGPATATLDVHLAAGPYRVRGRQDFALNPAHLDLRLGVTNEGDDRVPVGLGIHPWFRAGAVSVPAASAWPGEPLPSGLPRPVTPEEDLRSPRLPPPMDRCYTDLVGDVAELPGVRLRWSGPITQVVVFSGVAGWVCVEPVTNANDGFRLADAGVEGTGTIALDPGASTEVGYRFEWS